MTPTRSLKNHDSQKGAKLADSVNCTSMPAPTVLVMTRLKAAIPITAKSSRTLFSSGLGETQRFTAHAAVNTVATLAAATANQWGQGQIPFQGLVACHFLGMRN